MNALKKLLKSYLFQQHPGHLLKYLEAIKDKLVMNLPLKKRMRRMDIHNETVRYE